MTPPVEIRPFIEAHASFFVLGHREPDGDCIASQIAVAELLRAMGKQATLHSAGPFDRPEIEEFAGAFSSTIPEEAARALSAAVVVVDCSTTDRTGGLCDRLSGLDCLVVDHHSSGEDFGTLRYIDSSAASTTMLVWSLYEAFGMTPAKYRTYARNR